MNERKRLAQSLVRDQIGYFRSHRRGEQCIEEDFMEYIKNQVLPDVKRSVKNFDNENFPCTLRFKWQMGCSHPSGVMEMIDEVLRSDKADEERKNEENTM